jgi:hypothetical protein
MLKSRCSIFEQVEFQLLVADSVTIIFKKITVTEFYTPTRLFFGEIRWVLKSKKPVNTAFHELSNINNLLKSGGEENRTPVQTYSSKAFYMFIC